MANFMVFVSKNRNRQSEHLRSAPHHLIEHLARYRNPKNEHCT
jgi:hypothetical protein